MKKKDLLAVFVICLIISIFAACSTNKEAINICGKTYVYDKEGFGSDFTISFYEDNKFHYSEGGLSSYIGYGIWEIKNKIITLHDVDMPFCNNFILKGNKLVWQEKNSSNFLYLKISDGDTFSEADENYMNTEKDFIMYEKEVEYFMRKLIDQR
ncbi:MAG: hypothetical protein IKP51_00330 [Treponema sp.]|nr:hypothetical protein [Treponema sp.]